MVVVCVGESRKDKTMKLRVLDLGVIHLHQPHDQNLMGRSFICTSHMPSVAKSEVHTPRHHMQPARSSALNNAGDAVERQPALPTEDLHTRAHTVRERERGAGGARRRARAPAGRHFPTLRLLARFRLPSQLVAPLRQIQTDRGRMQNSLRRRLRARRSGRPSV